MTKEETPQSQERDFRLSWKAQTPLSYIPTARLLLLFSLQHPIKATTTVCATCYFTDLPTDSSEEAEKKTRVCKLPEEKFDFLGYTFGRCYSMRRGRVFLGTVPSKKRVQRICRDISDETRRDKVWQDSKTVVERLNRM